LLTAHFLCKECARAKAMENDKADRADRADMPINA
jgi:hypothetical protein